jgi:methylated-DNA-[protein]-cysteine S-methyltransferase
MKELRNIDVEDASARAAAVVADRAARDGLIDVGYSFVDSPFGKLLVAATPRGLVRLAYPNEDPDATLETLAAVVSPRILESAVMTDDVRRQLEEYFEGDRNRFDLTVDLALRQGFTRRVLRAATRIPFGQVATYTDIARRAGSPKAVRAAGNALGSNPVPIVVPCHRVVRTGGGLGGYTGGLERKEFLLELEGVLPWPGQSPARFRRRT